MNVITYKQFFEQAKQMEEYRSWFDNIEDVAGHISESVHCNALSFFGIEVNEEAATITLSRPITEEDFTTVNDYLDHVEDPDESDYTNPTAKAYDDWTYDKRGADDGTYDYAGTFVVCILEILMEIQ